MEYRRDPRFRTNQPISVTDLENSSSPQPGLLADFSNQGISLRVPGRLFPGTAVKVEWAGTLLLGEVIYCRPAEEGFQAGLRLENALYDTDSLAAMVVERPVRLRRALSV
jgi:PilZ domain